MGTVMPRLETHPIARELCGSDNPQGFKIHSERSAVGLGFNRCCLILRLKNDICAH